MALAGFGLSSCRRPEAHLVPFTKSVEWTIPGQAALLCDRDAAAHRRVAARGHARSMAGRLRSKAIRFIRRAAERPTLSPRLRFSISMIRRVRSVSPNKWRRNRGRHRKTTHFETRDRAAFDKYLEELRPKIAADGGAGLAFLVEEMHSPTRERLRVELVNALSEHALVRLRCRC